VTSLLFVVTDAARLQGFKVVFLKEENPNLQPAVGDPASAGGLD